MSLLTSRLGRGPSWMKALPFAVPEPPLETPTALVELGKDVAAAWIQAVTPLTVAIGRAARAAILGVPTLLSLLPEVALLRSAVRLLAPCGWALLLGGSALVSCCCAVRLRDAFGSCCGCSCKREQLCARLRARLRALRAQRSRACGKRERQHYRGHCSRERWRRNRNDHFSRCVGHGVARKSRRARSQDRGRAPARPAEDKAWFCNAVGRFQSWCGGVLRWLYGGEADEIIKFMA